MVARQGWFAILSLIVLVILAAWGRGINIHFLLLLFSWHFGNYNENYKENWKDEDGNLIEKQLEKGYID